MTTDNRSFIAKYSRVLRKALSSKHIAAFLTRQTLARSRATRRLFHLYLKTASPEDVPHRRVDPGSQIVLNLPVDAAMTAHLRAFSQDLGERLGHGRLTVAMDLKLYELRDCEILPWVGVTVHRPTERVVDGAPDAQPRLASRVREVPGKVLSLLSEPRGHGHYFHFFERLTVALRIIRWIGADEPLTLLVREEQTAFQAAAYGALPKRFPHLRIVAVGEGEIVRPERLYLPKRTLDFSYGCFALADEWREIGALYREAYGLTSSGGGRKVHLTRRRQRIRRILNEDALEAVFERHGYETIAPETLSHAEQVRMMTEASEVASVSGAAITNIVFADQPIRLVVMCPREIDEPFWEALALLLGHRLDYVEGDTAVWNDHFTVAPEKLEAALSAPARAAA